MQGPAFMGAGFWEGQSAHDICAHLTSFSSDFWLQHRSECARMVRQRTDTFLVSVETLLYSLLLYRCVTGYMTHLTFVRPILRELRQMRSDHAMLRIEGKPAPRWAAEPTPATRTGR